MEYNHRLTEIALEISTLRDVIAGQTLSRNQRDIIEAKIAELTQEANIIAGSSTQTTGRRAALGLEASSGSGSGITCSRCGSLQANGSRHCTRCGAGLVKVCAVCGSDNHQSVRYCAGCGVDTTTTKRGMSLERAALWRRQFSAMGWWESPFGTRGSSSIQSILRQQRLPVTPDDPAEYWIFSCAVTGQDWKIRYVGFVNETTGKKGESHSGGFAVATRARIMYLDPRKGHFLQLPFGGASGKTQLDAVMFASGQGGFALKVKTKGPRWIDRAFMLGHAMTDGHHEGEYVVAAANVAAARGNRVEFMGILSEFVLDAVGPENTRPGKTIPSWW